MQHHIFFEVLATFSDDEPGWETIMLGCLVMRAVDAWLKIGPIEINVDPSAVATQVKLEELSGTTLSTEIDAKTTDALRQILLTLPAAPDRHAKHIEAPLYAYGLLLEEDGHWGLAADVYHTIAEAFFTASSLTSADFAAAAHAYRKEAWALRSAQQYDRAKIAYRTAIRLARKAGDEEVWIRARLGLASMARVRGNLPAAQRILTKLLAVCETISRDVATRVRPDILHEQAALFADQDRSVEALSTYYEAYESSRNSTSKEFILTDIGICALHLGFLRMAKDALDTVVLTGMYGRARQSAIIHLMLVAVFEGDQTEFERRRAQWQPQYCSALTNAYARFFIARGLERFATTREALSAYADAVDFAERAGIHMAQFEALKELERLKQSTNVRGATTTARPLPRSLMPISDILSQLHSSALLNAEH